MPEWPLTEKRGGRSVVGLAESFRQGQHDEAGAPSLRRAVRVARTKLRPPTLRDDVIHRGRLLEDLQDSLLSCPLTLVSAPAGYGKTTLLASLSHELPEVPLAWLSLDDEDDDATRFLAAFILCIEELEPAYGVNAEVLLSNLGNPGAEMLRVVDALINEILDNIMEPFVVVLDDLHRISSPATYTALDYLLEHLPEPLHLVVSTRQDPTLSMARLRARRQVHEVRLDDLRFTPDEANQFLNDTLHLDLSPEHLEILRQRTEGWAAGMSLLVDSLRRTNAPADRDGFVENVAQSERLVSDFLAEEVLASQEQEVQDFLLQTAILTELTPALCTAVTGRDDAPAMLESLYRWNLFVMALDPANDTFRYHDFFKEFLLGVLERRMPEHLDELHRRAGEAETVPPRAIRHYSAAGMWDEAASVIERVGEQTIQQGSLEPLQGWIRSLPEEVREGYPGLSFLLGRCAWLGWELDDARFFFEQALEGFEQTDNETGQSETLVHLATCLSTMADIEAAAAATQRALAFSLPPHHRAQVLVERAWVSLARNEWKKTNADLDEAIAIAETSRDPRTLHAVAVDFNSPFMALPGGVDRAERLHRLLQTRAGDEVAPVQVAALVLNALIHVWRGRWDPARQAAQEALETSERFGGLLSSNAEAGVILPLYHAVQGDQATSDQYFEALFQGLEQPALAAFAGPWKPAHLYFLGRVRWAQGRLEEARDAFVRMHPAENTREWPMAPVVREMMAGLLCISDHGYAEAEQHLRWAAELQQQACFSVLFGNANLLLANLYLLWDRYEDAIAELAPVLDEHERHGTPGFILWEGNEMIPLLRLAVEKGVHTSFAAHVLDLFSSVHETFVHETFVHESQPATAPQASQTILSPREIEVLRLVADGLTDGQTAQKLYISPRTVGQHLRSIYRKLDVPSRAAAVRRAAELDLI